jgi:hypothetical protein
MFSATNVLEMRFTTSVVGQWEENTVEAAE